MTAYSTQGQTITVDAESALGTASGAATNLRVNEAPVGPKATRNLAPVNVVHYHPAATDDPIPFEMGMEAALSLTLDVRAGSAATTKAPLVRFLESAGCDVQIEGSDTTLDGYTNTTSWSLTADNAAVGQAGLLELVNGVYWPVLVATDSGGDVTPEFEIPSAAESGGDWARIHSVTPAYLEVASTETLQFTHTVRAAQTTNQTEYRYAGCALAAPIEISGQYGQPLTISPSFHVGDVSENDVAIASETFGDSIKKIFLAGSNYEVAFCNSSTSSISKSGNIFNVESWKVNLGINAVPVIGHGGAGALNGWQGYMTTYTPATVELVVLWSKDYSDDVEASTFQDKYFHVKVGNTTGNPCFGLWVPNMHLTTFPAPTSEGAYWKTTLTYTANNAGYGSQTGLTELGASPWYLALGVAK